MAAEEEEVTVVTSEAPEAVSTETDSHLAVGHPLNEAITTAGAATTTGPRITTTTTTTDGRMSVRIRCLPARADFKKIER